MCFGRHDIIAARRGCRLYFSRRIRWREPALQRVALTRHGVASRLVRTLTETYFPTHMYLLAPRGTL
jgi:hypothetical protein